MSAPCGRRLLSSAAKDVQDANPLITELLAYGVGCLEARCVSHLKEVKHIVTRRAARCDVMAGPLR